MRGQEERRGERISEQSAEPCSLLMVQQVVDEDHDVIDLLLGDVLRAEMVVAGGGFEKETHEVLAGGQLVEQREQLRRVQRSLLHQQVREIIKFGMRVRDDLLLLLLVLLFQELLEIFVGVRRNNGVRHSQRRRQPDLVEILSEFDH